MSWNGEPYDFMAHFDWGVATDIHLNLAGLQGLDGFGSLVGHSCEGIHCAVDDIAVEPCEHRTISLGP